MNTIKRLACLGGVLAIAICMYYLDIGCPFKNLFGIPCAGCGMTRAFIALIQLDFKSAFNYHPLVFGIPFIAIVFLFGDKFSKKFLIIFWASVVILFICVYFIKLMNIS